MPSWYVQSPMGIIINWFSNVWRKKRRNPLRPDYFILKILSWLQSWLSWWDSNHGLITGVFTHIEESWFTWAVSPIRLFVICDKRIRPEANHWVAYLFWFDSLDHWKWLSYTVNDYLGCPFSWNSHEQFEEYMHWHWIWLIFIKFFGLNPFASRCFLDLSAQSFMSNGHYQIVDA